MNKGLKGFILGFTVCSVLSSTVVFADTLEKSISVVYDNIKIIVDGNKIEPKDSNGNTVEPFTYNGTTYLPVRAIANAVGKELVWDSSTNTVYLGKKPDTTDNNDNKISNKYLSITKEGFARKVSAITAEPIEKTNVFNPDDTMYYVWKFDSISTDINLKVTLKYENENEVVLIDNYKITKDMADGKYMQVHLKLPDGAKLPLGNYTFKITGTKDTETVFEIIESSIVQ